MTEITRVPLQPIAKGAVSKIWLGVAAIVLAAGGVAYAALPPAPTVKTLTAGNGESPTLQDVVQINYKGMLTNGTTFDQGQHAILPVAGNVPGFTKALLKMQRGGKYKVEIPASLAYGATPPPGASIPPNSDLTFEVELLDFISRDQFEQRMQMMRQMQQMQQGAPGQGLPGGGAPGAAAPVQP